MPYRITPLEADKHQITQAMFIDTADDNYLVARWCFIESLNVDFFWTAVHLLEKYMKAVLLMNQQTAKGYGHDIAKLYKAVQDIASDLLPSDLDKPTEFPQIAGWRDATPEQFIDHLLDNGSADNRYHVFGHSRHYEDLFKLDQMVFMLRRLCHPLDAYYHLEPQADPQHEFTWRDLLREKPERFHISMNNRLEKIIRGKIDGPLRHVLMNMNFPFAGDEYEHANFPSSWSSCESVLNMAVYQSIKCSDPGEQQIGRDSCQWVLDNIQLPKNARDEMQGWLEADTDSDG